MVAFILHFVVSSISPGCMGSETSFIFLPPQAPGTLPMFKPHSVQILHLHFPCSESSILPIRDSLEKGGGGRKKERKKCKFAGHSLKESKRRWVGKKRRVAQPLHPSLPTALFPGDLNGPGHCHPVHALHAAAIFHFWARCEGQRPGRTGASLLKGMV